MKLYYPTLLLLTLVYVPTPNRKDRLLRVVEEYYLSIDPDNTVLAPTIKKKY